MPRPVLSRAQLTSYVRGRLPEQIFHECSAEGRGTAIYTLSDPREIRATRYVGQTGDPRRRYLQHLSTARLWLPDETPWWVKSVRLRPLYDWIRELHRDDGRLPVMVVVEWLGDSADARSAERARIHECLNRRLALLNVESDVLGPQVPLL